MPIRFVLKCCHVLYHEYSRVRPQCSSTLSLIPVDHSVHPHCFCSSTVLNGLNVIFKRMQMTMIENDQADDEDVESVDNDEK